MSDTPLIHFRHRVGDGVHYITEHPRTFKKDGETQRGDTSELCILLNLEIVLSCFGLPGLDELWNSVYPNDFMSVEDVSYIMSTAIAFSDEFNPRIPDNVADVLRDVQAMHCDELADAAEELLKSQGAVV